jgi:hypothetical protein
MDPIREDWNEKEKRKPCLGVYSRNIVFKKVAGIFVKYSTTGKPVPYALIKIFATLDKREVIKKVSSSDSKFFALLPNGYYYLTVETKNPDTGEYSLAYTSDPFNVKRGVVDKRIVI